MLVEKILMVVLEFNQDWKNPGDAGSEYFRGCMETAIDTIMLLIGEIPDAKMLVLNDMEEACVIASRDHINDAIPAVRRAAQKLIDGARYNGQ